MKPSKNRTRNKACDNTRYKNRNQVERFFNRIKQCRRVATRYEKTIANFASFVWLAALIIDVI
ncbi:MAG: transposase [Planctomycetales bacterium]|nr:transposase [Planctomycetales bacterium]